MRPPFLRGFWKLTWVETKIFAREPMGFVATLIMPLVVFIFLGFVIASVVPTARFAQPVSAAVLYPMLALSGLFYPVDRFPRALKTVAYLLPTTHAVALLKGVWDGSGWGAHWMNVAALLVLFAAF